MKKGIVLAGGSGTRLHPITRVISKQLLPVYNKPMIYYPLSSLMLCGVREILIITTPEDQSQFQRLLGDGSELGLSLSYAVQPRPEGLAQAFLIGEEFLSGSGSVLALGDNIFFGHDLSIEFHEVAQQESGATVFGYQVQDPKRYGVVGFDKEGKATVLVEKPEVPPSNYAVTGIYFYDPSVVERARQLKPSPRGELEITDLNRTYLDDGSLEVRRLGRGVAWLDTGTHASLIQASIFVQSIEERQGLMVGCVEEVAYRMGFIDRARLRTHGESLAKTDYGQYLLRIASEADSDS